MSIQFAGPSSGHYYDGTQWRMVFEGENVNLHGLWGKILRKMFWKIPRWVDQKLRPGRYIDAGFFYCPYVPVQFSSVVGGGFFVGENYYPIPTNIHAVWPVEMRTIMRKWVPFYPKPESGIGFKTRYDP